LSFAYRDLGQRKRGDIVEVVLQGNQANVLLMDSANFSSFKRNGTYRQAYGGLAERSQVHLAVPRSGHWYGVAFIPPGYRGSARAGFRVLPGALAPIREPMQSPLGSIKQAADDYAEAIGIDPDDKEYDVFISHASEDKADVVRPLAEALRARGLVVWFDEFELRIGDSLRRKIDAGIRASHFGIVVLSPSFFGKGWTNYELDGIVTLGVTQGRSVVLPVWHKVTQKDVAGYSPSLAGLLARSTEDTSIEGLADEIALVVHPDDEAA
jgi:TIR domain/Domain of unknown function (DUF1883)